MIRRCSDNTTALKAVFFGETVISSHDGLLTGRASAGNSFLLGIFGASGLASGLGNDTGASGYFLHVNRGKTGERGDKIATLNGWPFKYIYRAKSALATSWA